MGLEQGIVVTRIATDGRVAHHQFDGNPQNKGFILQRQNDGLTVMAGVQAASLDLNVEGRQEIAVVGPRNAAMGTVLVRILRRSESNAAANALMTSVGVERDGLRRDRLAISTGMRYTDPIDPATTIGWDGIYHARVSIDAIFADGMA